MRDFKLSKYFSFYELTITEHRELLDHNRQEAYTADNIASLSDLVSTLLVPIREHFNSPLIIHSGYRGPELNKAIGGSTTSQHMKAEAADFNVVGVSLQSVFDWVRFESGLKFGQIILEGYSSGAYSWVHISLPNLKTNQQALLFDGKHYLTP